MEDLAFLSYNEKVDKLGYVVTTRACRSSEDGSGSEVDEFDEKDLLISTPSLSPWPIVSSIRSRIEVSPLTRYRLPPKYARLWMLIWTNIRIFLPSFLPFTKGKEPASPRKLHPTAWLDGLRGTAAFLVVIHHSSRAWFSDRAFAGWGSGGDGLNSYIIQLPIIRLICSGYPQVAIFFVVSGYAISYKPMKLLQTDRAHEFFDSLAMSVFRRHMRLFMPAAGVMFLVAIITYMDWFGKGGGSHEPPHLPTLYEQLWDWGYAVAELAEPFQQRDTIARYSPPYDANLWTLPVEFRNSVIVYTTMLGLSKTRATVRLTCSLGLIFYCLYKTHWDIFLFLSGMLLADLRFRRQVTRESLHQITASPACYCNCEHQRKSTPHEHSKLPEWTRDPKFVYYFWLANFLTALFILSMPEVGRGSGTSPGFISLTSMIPLSYFANSKPDLFWMPIAAVYLVFVIDNAPHLQKIFNCSFAQYLGKISFSLYMVHGPILYSFGWHLQQRAVTYTGGETDRQYGYGIALTVAVLYPAFFWAADVVWRLIDQRAVEFGKWISGKVVS